MDMALWDHSKICLRENTCDYIYTHTHVNSDC